jgi:hypothetical protein
MAVLALASANAQEETQKLSFAVGGGFTVPVGSAGQNLANGWNVRSGFGYNFTSHVGAMLDIGYDGMNINGATLGALGVPGGDVRVFSATLDPIVHLNPHGSVDFYLIGGGGVFHRFQEFTQPTVAVVNVYNPFFGVYPVAFNANQVLASYTVTRPGFDIGAGVAIGSKWHGKFFAESRWEHMFENNSHLDMIPVTFGYRW